MRSILLFILCGLFYKGAFSQVKTISIKEFGAKPGDNLSDQAAFISAAEYINKRKGDVKLVIEAGTYLVGPPYKYNLPINQLPLSQQWNVFVLNNCKNVIIEGIGKPVIKFLDNIPFGCVPYRSDKKDSSVHIGTLFRFTSCDDISIRNISAHGNNTKFRLLNNWGIGPNPYEREHEGLFITSCRNVTVDNSNFNYFGRDGVIILEDEDKQRTQRVKFSKCEFNYNGRDGVSWCGGADVSFYNCLFNYNASGKIATNPGCGIDVEPERGGECKRGSFLKCTFMGNAGYGMVSMNAGATSSLVFDSCKIYGNTNYALITNSPYVSFKNSDIIGTSVFSYDAASEETGMKISNCNFRDSLAGQKIQKGAYMLSIQGRYMRFDNCNFTSFIVPSLYTEIRKKRGNNDPENTIFRNCVFNANFKKFSTWSGWAFLVSHSHFIGCSFNSGGVADFKGILGQGEKNIYQQNSRFNKL